MADESGVERDSLSLSGCASVRSADAGCSRASGLDCVGLAGSSGAPFLCLGGLLFRYIAAFVVIVLLSDGLKQKRRLLFLPGSQEDDVGILERAGIINSENERRFKRPVSPSGSSRSFETANRIIPFL